MDFLLTPLTPISVGAEKESHLHPQTDYVRAVGEDDELYAHYLDPVKIGASVQRHPHTVAKLEADLRRQRPSALKSWLGDLAPPRVDALDHFTRQRVRMSGVNDAEQDVPIHTIIKDPHHRPYIPGSSLKGSIRAALLYAWLTYDQEGTRALEQWMEWFDNAEVGFDRKKFAKLTERKATEMLEDGLFGPVELERGHPRAKLHRTDAGWFGCSDTATFRHDSLVVLSTMRYHRGRKDLKTPIFTEAIWPGQDTPESVRFELRVQLPDSHGRPGLSHPFLIKALSSPKAFLDCIGKYGEDFMRQECTTLETHPRMQDIVDFYQSELDHKTPRHRLRIGNGKGWLMNSIGLAVAQQDPQFTQTIRTKLNLQNNPTRNDHFPTTRAVALQDQEPIDTLGWAMLQSQIG